MESAPRCRRSIGHSNRGPGQPDGRTSPFGRRLPRCTRTMAMGCQACIGAMIGVRATMCGSRERFKRAWQASPCASVGANSASDFIHAARPGRSRWTCSPPAMCTTDRFAVGVQPRRRASLQTLCLVTLSWRVVRQVRIRHRRFRRIVAALPVVTAFVASGRWRDR